jgi:hypothetical protein
VQHTHGAMIKRSYLLAINIIKTNPHYRVCKLRLENNVGYLQNKSARSLSYKRLPLEGI